MAGDEDLIAYAYIRRANIALYQQDSYGTISFARRATQTMKCSRRVKGLALLREAQGHALTGDYDAFRECISLAAAAGVRGRYARGGGVTCATVACLGAPAYPAGRGLHHGDGFRGFILEIPHVRR